jgi:hypothetical protein
MRFVMLGLIVLGLAGVFTAPEHRRPYELENIAQDLAAQPGAVMKDSVSQADAPEAALPDWDWIGPEGAMDLPPPHPRAFPGEANDFLND